MVASRSYIRDGAEIYRNSFAIIRAEADLQRFTGRAEKVAVRIIHASGMVEIAEEIGMSPDFAERAVVALQNGAPILCDTQMVAHGITRSRLPAANQVACTIGDAAVRLGLDVLGPTSASATFMPRLEHVQLCHPDDRRRFAELGVAASIQPIHLREDAPGARRDWGDRAESAGYTWRSLLDAGATVALGQDAPLEPLDPWPGIALAVLRRDPTWGADAAPFGPGEAITLEAALRASTVGPWQTLRDPLGGRLVPGSLADVVVLPSMPDEALLRTAEFERIRPRLVLVGGETAFER